MVVVKNQGSSVAKQRRNSSSRPTVRWVKEWIPQNLVRSGGKCSLLKWFKEDTSRALREKSQETTGEQKPESTKPIKPTTEELILCTYGGCGKVFRDYSEFKKHTHVQGRRQNVCQYEGCDKIFWDSSKLKRHHLIHTGERPYACPHEGCGKTFSLDFNLKAHMKIHLQENYHVCPYPDCGKKHTQENKLQTHIRTYHDKGTAIDTMRYTARAKKPQCTPRATAIACGASVARPYACPYEGCGKAYIHEYKLKLHLQRGHLDQHNETMAKTASVVDNDQDAYIAKGAVAKNLKRKKPYLEPIKHPAKVTKHEGSGHIPTSISAVWQQYSGKEIYEDDSEETEEDEDKAEDGKWIYQDPNGDPEETEDDEN